MATATDLKDDFYWAIGRSAQNDSSIPIAAVYRLLNEGQMRLAEDGGLIVNTTTSFTTTADTQEYTLNSLILSIQKVLYCTSTVLYETPYQSIDEADEPGDVEYYYRRMVSGAMKLGLWAVPDSAGNTVQVWFDRLPKFLTSSVQTATTQTTTPEYSEQWHRALLDYALWQYWETGGRDMKKAKDHERQWRDEKQRVRARGSKLTRMRGIVVKPYDIRME